MCYIWSDDNHRSRLSRISRLFLFAHLNLEWYLERSFDKQYHTHMKINPKLPPYKQPAVIAFENAYKIVIQKQNHNYVAMPCAEFNKIIKDLNRTLVRLHYLRLITSPKHMCKLFKRTLRIGKNKCDGTGLVLFAQPFRLFEHNGQEYYGVEQGLYNQSVNQIRQVLFQNWFSTENIDTTKDLTLRFSIKRRSTLECL